MPIPIKQTSVNISGLLALRELTVYVLITVSIYRKTIFVVIYKVNIMTLYNELLLMLWASKSNDVMAPRDAVNSKPSITMSVSSSLLCFFLNTSSQTFPAS